TFCVTTKTVIKLPVVEDTGISSERGHFDDNDGASVTVPIRQNQNWSGFETKAYLMRFDTGPLRGITVRRAWLNVFLAAGDLYAVGLSTVLSDWEEGEGLNGQTGRGGASWNWAREPQDGKEPGPLNYWSWRGSGIFSVSWAHPDARYWHAGPRMIEKKVMSGQVRYLRIPVARELVEALSTGLAKGLILTDDKGQVAEGYSLKGSGQPYFYDRSQDAYLYTRDVQDPALRPFLEVEVSAADKVSPGAVEGLEVVSAEPCDPSVTVSFTAPADDSSSGGAALGYEVCASSGPLSENEWESASRLPLWAVPKPEAPGTRQEMRVFTLPPGTYNLALRAKDEAGNLGPLSQCEVTIPGTPEVRLEIPRSVERRGGAGEVVFDNLLTVWACPDLCKVDPVGGGILLDGENYREAGDFSKENNVWSGAVRTVYLEAARGEVVACQLILGRAGEGKLTGLQVVPGDLDGPSGVLRAKGNISCYRVWYLDVVPRKEELAGPWELVEEVDHRPAWHGDACLPLDPPFDPRFNLPTMDNMGPGQRCQSVWIDFYVPPSTEAGLYQGRIAVTAKEIKRPAVIAVRLNVLPLVLPSEISWSVELNGYNYGINKMFGVTVESDLERYLAIERRCYQLAHQHRTTLNILPYGQDGQVQAGCAPTLKGSGRETKIDSWEEWDRRFSQYLHGEAFTPANGYQGPGTGVPLTHMYLPFHENWPLPIKEHYGDWADLPDRDKFTEWAKTSRPLEQAFDRDYQEGFVSVTRQFFEHLKNKGFTRTHFQVYVNNKYYFKCNFFGMPNEGPGSSFWLLDEPVDYDDYAANRFFLSLAKKGHAQACPAGEVKLHLRTDISQPEMSRGLWDGLCNLWNSSGIFDFGPTATFRMRRLPGEGYYHYGGGPRISGKLIVHQQNFFTCWSLGTVGDLPYWNNLAGFSWFNPDDLAIFYTGIDYARTGKNYEGPLASVRLKGMRRGQQDIEYLNLLAARKGWNRGKVLKALAAWADDPEAPVLRFRSLTNSRLLELRKAVVAALLAE
ncbi:MAG TPA: hypothetical protein VM123_15740, partial [archaeon]|nr:hypothetical protein [archaeon]